MTPRQRVEAVLTGRRPDVVPCTIYTNKLPRCQVELELRNAGMCLLERSPNTFNVATPNCTTTTTTYVEDGTTYVKTVTETPGGMLRSINRPRPDTTWQVKRPFSGPEDYRPLRALVADRVYTENYAVFERARRRYGDGAFLRGGMGYSPLQEIIYSFMGVEQFAVEWMERRDEVLALYDVMNESMRRLYPVAAASPALATNYGGNVSPEIVGKERFEKYILPCYDEAADVFHKHGKLMGVHFDANNQALKEGIARSRMDYVEAFTPPPDCDMSVAEALEAWPDKVLWINFPSSVHHQGSEGVVEHVRKILAEAAPGDRFIMGITEDVPDDKWETTFPALMRVVNEEGRLPLSR